MMPNIAPPSPGAMQVPQGPPIMANPGVSQVPQGPPVMMPGQMPPSPNQGLGQGTQGAPNIDPRKMQYHQDRMMNLGFSRGFQPGGGMMY